MEKSNPLREKSYAFALQIISMHQQLIQERHFVIANQLLCAGTSIGANIEEAMQGQSRKDFISKLSIALKEAYETRFWLRLIKDASLLHPQVVQSRIIDVEEIIRLLVSIIKTSKFSS